MTVVCALCSRVEPYMIAHEEPLWQVVLHRNQHYLGKTMLVLRRHEEALPNLSEAEVLTLWSLLRRVHEALYELFQPDHYNNVFLMNRTRHIHLQVIPRYASPRTLATIVFEDGRLGEHYDPRGERLLTPRAYAALAEALEERLAALAGRD